MKAHVENSRLLNSLCGGYGLLNKREGNCKSELVLLLNKTKASDDSFQSPSHVNGFFAFTIVLYDVKELVLPHLQQAGV